MEGVSSSCVAFVCVQDGICYGVGWVHYLEGMVGVRLYVDFLHFCAFSDWV